MADLIFPDERKSQFENDRLAVTREAANSMASLFNKMVKRGEDRQRAQRLVLQCVVAMFAEDIDLIPRKLFTELVGECRADRKRTSDLLGSLFRQMDADKPARGGRYEGVPHFNGGLFSVIEPIEWREDELTLLDNACAQNWAQIEPPIFGTLFQASLGKAERHALGAHFTSEAEIHRVITPTIVRPWGERIASAKTARELTAVHKDLLLLRVLDPACGSGNFLYVAFRELKKLELEIIARLRSEFAQRTEDKAKVAHLSVKQLYGIDKEPFTVELAKVELLLAKKLALDEAQAMIEKRQLELDDIIDSALPLDNLDDNIVCDDALFCEWPRAHVIIGNPPYQSKNKAQHEYGRAYLNRVHKAYPDVSGQADHCVYWFRRAHDELPPGGRAGLVGTKTIRENKSREGGLGYIVGHGGTITEAVSTQVWPGEAVLHVSIVNWVKGKADHKKVLWEQAGDDVDSPWRRYELPTINAALSPRCDVTTAKTLACNMEPKTTYQGQTPGSTKGFVVSNDLAAAWVKDDSANAAVLFPYLIGDDLLDNPESTSERTLIDFDDLDIAAASRYAKPFKHVEKSVLRKRQDAAQKEETRNTDALAEAEGGRTNKHHKAFLRRWWKLAYRRTDMLDELRRLPRYVACSRVTRRPIFEFISSKVRPGDALQVFAFSDDYSFGILQSDIHWRWFTERCSGLKVDPRYTSETVYSTFPWPQAPTPAQARAIASAAMQLRTLRRGIAREQQIGFRQLYRSLELPGTHPLKDAHAKLDAAVRSAYGMPAKEDPLSFLLAQNLELAQREADGNAVVGPGLPPSAGDRRPYFSKDSVSFYLAGAGSRKDL